MATSVAVSPDGRSLASGSGDGTIRIWDLATGRTIRTLPGHAETVLSVAISPDGQWLVSGGAGVSGAGLIKVWDLAAGRTVRTFVIHRGAVRAAISPDGRWLVSSGGGVGVWEFATGRKIADHSFVTNSVGAAVTLDGERVVFAADNELAVLEPATDRLVRTLSGHTGDVYTIAISADGRQLASGGADRMIKVWELTTGRYVRSAAMPGRSKASLSVPTDSDWSPAAQIARSRSGSLGRAAWYAR